ncbi:hypothetical protein ACQKL5_10870 [Peribacillus sp. NPDC097675]|uniref:hypothetical protein n=1 Tax=Peribacillus sp. NPDC097675 TaxID=3390618 RepID=UPI003D047715
MKKWLVLSFILLNLVGCTDGNEMVGGKPPKVLIEMNNESYETKLGTYCWSNNKGNTCVDMAGTVELLADKKPIEALPGEKVTIKMDYEPKPNETHVTQFNANEKNEETDILLRDNQFTVPKEKGIYYYAYSVWWMDEEDASISKGDALYAFVLEVK